MGYLTAVGTVPAFSRVVISFWFRVTSAQLAAARASFDPDADPIPQMAGILPLMMFGPDDLIQKTYHFGSWTYGAESTIHDHTWSSIDAEWHDNPPPYRTIPNTGTKRDSLVALSPSILLNPGFIGIDCTTSENILTFNFPFEQGEFGTGEWLDNQVDAISRPSVIDAWQNIPVPTTTPPGAPPYSSYTETRHLEDISSLYAGKFPERFGTFPQNGAYFIDGTVPGVRVTANRWHHVILNLDLRSDVSVEGTADDYGGSPPPSGTVFGEVSSASQIYLAYDKVNKTNRAISYYAASGAGGGEANDMLTPTAWDANSKVIDLSLYNPSTFLTGEGQELTQEFTNVPTTPSYSFTPPVYDMGQIYIPGSADFNRGAILAELQIYANVDPELTIDTSNSVFRALFVDSQGKPTTMGTAADYFGQAADVSFSGKDNWALGASGGTGGDYASVGTIAEYTTGPSLS